MDFLKNNKRLSFKLDGQDAWDLDYETEITEDGNTITTVYSFKDGLKVTNIAKKYDKFGAYEWVNYLENTSDKCSGIISELWDCDCALPLEHEEPWKRQTYHPDRNTVTKIYAPSGSDCSTMEFACDVDCVKEDRCQYHLYVGETKKYACTGGRSSQGNAPFFNINKKNCGYIIAIGWSGQWNAEITREIESVTLRSKIEYTCFKIMPGEKFRTSSIVIMPYKNGVTQAHNEWRKLVKSEFSLLGKPGRPEYAPFSYMIWGGLKSEEVLKRINCMKNNSLPNEYVWMDAGWYGKDTNPSPDEFEGDWPQHVGDWRISRIIHPKALRDVSEAIHKAGKKFVLWFEPERVMKDTKIELEHPEYVLYAPGAIYNNLLNLGNQDAWNYCFNMLSEYISNLKIDCLRIDFNINPLGYWWQNDDSDRSGITEIKYINGLYKLWDALLERFLNLIIDNCASGGRRIDIETLRRSVPLWRSDQECWANFDIEGVQNHSLSFSRWIPFSGTGGGRSTDEYRIRSSYAPGVGYTNFYSEKETESYKNDVEILKKYGEEYLKVRPYLSEDFYPLTEVTTALDVWCAMQYDRPSEQDGVIQVFRRENSPYETATFMLGGIDANAEYVFTDADGGEFTISGKELKESGLKLTVSEKRKAKVYFYKALQSL
ncbi:MAG: alpha-galactosidase [Clostridia bacterium]|nr:alpha-galactosidase [Clostridia bacterium]